MIAVGRDSVQLGSAAAWRARFEQMRPELEYRARHAFRGVAPPRLEQLVREVIEHAFEVFVNLAERGKADIVYVH